MTPTQRKAMEMALDALEDAKALLNGKDGTTMWFAKEITALREALAEQALQRLSDIHQEMEAGQNPVAAQHRFRHPQKGTPDWSVWRPCKVSQRLGWEVDSQGYEVEYRALYTHPAPETKEQV